MLRLRRVAGGADLHGQGREVVIGRAATCTIPLRTVADTVVSKRHAAVTFAPDGAATVTDLGSQERHVRQRRAGRAAPPRSPSATA